MVYNHEVIFTWSYSLLIEEFACPFGLIGFLYAYKY